MIRAIRTSNRRKRKKAFHSRAWLNGVEVTRDCFYADDRRGVVRVFRRNADGCLYVAPHGDGAAWLELHGRVRIGRAEGI